MTVSTKPTPATKYRVAIRDIARQNDWVFTQLGHVDRFTKGDAIVAVEHGPSNLITRAEMVRGKDVYEVARSKGKMFDVQAWLTGQPDPEQQRYIKLTPEQVRKYESGQGIAKIDGGTTLATKIEQADAKPAPKPKATPKPKAEAKPAPKPGPAPKPQPRAAKTAPAAKAAAK